MADNGFDPRHILRFCLENANLSMKKKQTGSYQHSKICVATELHGRGLEWSTTGPSYLSKKLR